MNNTMTKTTGALAVVLLAVAAASSGCSETELQGVITDDDLNTPELMISLVRGSNSEVTDVWAVGSGYWWSVLSGTDDWLNDGTASSEEEVSVSDFRERQIADPWNQGMEASWSGLKAVDRMQEVLDPENFERSPLVARAYINAGYGERLLGDAYGEAAYGFGLGGGFLLEGELTYDNSVVVPRDSIFQRAATFFQLGLEYAERALSAGVEAPDGDPLFDPQRLVWAAHGGLAQAHMALASLGRDPDQNWDLAVQHAQQVPIEFVEYSHHHELVEINEAWDWTWDNDDITVWGAVIDGTLYGTPATALWEDDPRISVTHCGDFADPSAGIGSEIVDNEVCSPDDDYRAESNDVPDWAPDKFDEEGSDVAMVRGTEMMLIRAEAAMVDGALGTFTNRVNDVRNFYGADPINEPSSVGEFEWPNAEDDARSILDRERYLTLWLEGRRAFDLARWDHPWYTEGHSLLPRHADLIQGARLFNAIPIPDEECTLNEGLDCPVLSGG